MASDPTVLIEVKIKDLFTQEFKKVVGEVNKFDQSIAPAVDKATSRFAGLGSSIRTAIEMFAGYATIQGINNAVNSFAKLDSARKTFEMLGSNIGDTQDAVKQWSETLRGTVDETAILQAANSALASGLVKTKEEFDAVSKAAYVLSRASGDTVAQSLDELTSGLASGRPQALSKLGIDLQSRFSDEQERFGRELSREEKQHLMINAMLEVTVRQYDKLSGGAVTLNETLQQSAVAWGDIEEAIGEATKVFAEFKLTMAKGITEAIGYWQGLGEAIGITIGLAEAYIRGDWKSTAFPKEPPVSDRRWKEIQDKWLPAGPQKGEVMEDGSISKGTPPKHGGTQVYMEPFTFGPLPTAPWQDADEYLGRLDSARQKSMLLAESNARMASGMDKMWKSAKLGVMAYSDSIGTATDMVADAVKSSLEAVESSLEDVLVDSMMGKMKTFKEYMLSLLEDISRAIAKMMVRMMIMKPLMGALEGATGIDFGMGSEKPKEYAAGGISWSRQLAVVDAGEAHVPLVGGRSIPVEMSGGGGGGGEVHFHFHGGDGQSIKRMLHQEEDYLRALMRRDLGSDPGLRGAVRRTR